MKIWEFVHLVVVVPKWYSTLYLDFLCDFYECLSETVFVEMKFRGPW